MKMDYKTLKMEDMLTYVKTNDAKNLKAFATAATKQHTQQIYVDVVDENGEPVYYTDKKGNTKVKKRRINKEGGKVTTTTAIFEAKKWFYDTYKDKIEFENAPKEKEANALLEELLSYL